MDFPVPDRDVAGIVINVQRYSLHDGHGIRTIVFLKGCPLRCHWCSNPESQRPEPELASNPGRCLGVEACHWCASICPADALSFSENGGPRVDRETCTRCMSCAGICPTQALLPYGKTRTVREILDLVERDCVFFSRSGGGMTLSGGEPLMQSRFALALLREARRRRIDCAIETCGHVPWTVLAEASSLVRTPIIPLFNDTAEDIGAILDLVAHYPRVDYEILLYHRIGSQKYLYLDRAFPMGEAVLDTRRVETLRALVAERRSRPGFGSGLRIDLQDMSREAT